MTCESCGKIISQGVQDFSIGLHGRALCIACQIESDRKRGASDKFIAYAKEQAKKYDH